MKLLDTFISDSYRKNIFPHPKPPACIYRRSNNHGGGQRPYGSPIFSVNVVKTNGRDVFLFNDYLTTVGGDGQIVTTLTSKRLDPFDRKSAIGMTKGKTLILDGLLRSMERDNYDWESVGKFMYADKEFGKYMTGRYPKSADWRSMASAAMVGEELIPVLVQSGMGSYVGFAAKAAQMAKASSLESIMGNPAFLKNMTEQEVRLIANSTPGWKVGGLGKGNNIGKGLTVREYNRAGNDFTHRYIRYKSFGRFCFG